MNPTQKNSTTGTSITEAAEVSEHTEVVTTEVPTTIPLATMREDSLSLVSHQGVPLVVIRTRGEVFAYHDRCPHAFWPLSEGTLSNGVLECPGHGWEFDVATGRCLNAPANCLTPVAVTVVGDTVRLQWKETEPAKGNRCGASDASDTSRATATSL